MLKGQMTETVADFLFLSNQIKDELICVKREKKVVLKLEVDTLKDAKEELKGEMAETITDCKSLAKIIREQKDLIAGSEAGQMSAVTRVTLNNR